MADAGVAIYGAVVCQTAYHCLIVGRGSRVFGGTTHSLALVTSAVIISVLSIIANPNTFSLLFGP